jgi:hypothetical protein
MYRFVTKTALIGLTAIVAANAGQVQIGGTNGLTSAYFSNPNANGCATTCVTGSTTGFTETTYNSSLFQGVTPAVAPSTVSLTDNTNGVTFNMINDSGNNDYVEAGSGSSSNITIPVGVLDVSSVWTMLNTELAGTNSLGDRDANIILNFGQSSNATSVESIVVKLTNSNSPYNAAAIGMLQNSVLCSSGSNCTGTGPGGTNGAVGPTPAGPVAPSSALQSSGPLGAGITSGITVDTNTLYSQSYTATSGTYSGTSGNVVLDDQGLIFSSAFLSALGSYDYLVSVQIRDPETTAGSSLGLSAVTVDTYTPAPAPEPSTILLCLAGFGALAFGAFKNRLAARS